MLPASRRTKTKRCAAELLALVLSLPLFAFAQSGGSSSSFETAMWNQEQGLAKAEMQQDRAYFEKTLDDKLIYVTFNGVVLTKDKIVKGLNYIDVSHYTIENMKVRVLGTDAALVTYDLKVKGNVAGHDLPAKQYASSVWVNESNHWQLIFHQVTPAHHQ
jgi:hypothetical protein